MRPTGQMLGRRANAWRSVRIRMRRHPAFINQIEEVFEEYIYPEGKLDDLYGMKTHVCAAIAENGGDNDFRLPCPD